MKRKKLTPNKSAQPIYKDNIRVPPPPHTRATYLHSEAPTHPSIYYLSILSHKSTLWCLQYHVCNTLEVSIDFGRNDSGPKRPTPKIWPKLPTYQDPPKKLPEATQAETTWPKRPKAEMTRIRPQSLIELGTNFPTAFMPR